MGTHIGASVDHTTHRAHGLTFRAGTAMWGHLGLEWDLSSLTDAELTELGEWVAFHRQVRELLHTGNVVRADLANQVLNLEGVVAADRSDALYRLSALDHTVTWPTGRVPLPGLDPDARYGVTVQPPGDEAVQGPYVPRWVREGLVLTGRVLAEVGVQAPLLDVDHLVLLRATRE
jgi:alpha-galactosidase